MFALHGRAPLLEWNSSPASDSTLARSSAPCRFLEILFSDERDCRNSDQEAICSFPVHTDLVLALSMPWTALVIFCMQCVENLCLQRLLHVDCGVQIVFLAEDDLKSAVIKICGESKCQAQFIVD